MSASDGVIGLVIGFEVDEMDVLITALLCLRGAAANAADPSLRVRHRPAIGCANPSQ